MTCSIATPQKGELTRILASIATAAVLWFVMFSPWTSPVVPFWPCMAASAVLLTCLALSFGGRRCMGIGVGEGSSPALTSALTTLAFGVAIAAVLWGVFWVGDKVSQWMFSFARAQVNLIYNMKDGFSPTVLALLLLFVIGPAEEIFWRGYVQRTLAGRTSPLAAFAITTAVYTLVHLPSGNFMLIMAALVCGIAWGGLYWLMPHRLTSIIISHALWDAAAFVWLPL